MKKLLIPAATCAFVLSMGTTTVTANADKAQTLIDFCHFTGHAANDDLPLPYPKGDHFITSNGFTHTAATCKTRGGTVIRIGCPSIKGHVPSAPHHHVDQFCDFVR